MYIHRRMSSADTSKAPHGKLPPSEQYKLWALGEVLNKEGEDTAQYEWMSQQVQVRGGGSLGREAVRASSRAFKRLKQAGVPWKISKRLFL